MTPPNYQRYVCKFIGSVNYYYYIWKILSHTLKPLTELTSNKIDLKWTEVEQKQCEEIKRIVSCKTLLAYPDLNACFKVHTNAINL